MSFSRRFPKNPDFGLSTGLSFFFRRRPKNTESGAVEMSPSRCRPGGEWAKKHELGSSQGCGQKHMRDQKTITINTTCCGPICFTCLGCLLAVGCGPLDEIWVVNPLDLNSYEQFLWKSFHLVRVCGCFAASPRVLGASRAKLPSRVFGCIPMITNVSGCLEHSQ